MGHGPSSKVSLQLAAEYDLTVLPALAHSPSRGGADKFAALPEIEDSALSFCAWSRPRHGRQLAAMVVPFPCSSTSATIPYPDVGLRWNHPGPPLRFSAQFGGDGRALEDALKEATSPPFPVLKTSLKTTRASREDKGAVIPTAARSDSRGIRRGANLPILWGRRMG